MRSTTAPYTESRLAHLVRNKCVGFPVVEQSDFRLQAFLSAVCEHDVQSFTVARWKDFLPHSEYKGQMSLKYKKKI